MGGEGNGEKFDAGKVGCKSMISCKFNLVIIGCFSGFSIALSHSVCPVA